MNKVTGYPSIDQTHKKNESYFKLNPIIPNISIYNIISLLSIFYRNNIAVDCLDLTVTYDKLINDSIIVSKAFKELGIKENDIISVSMPNLYQAIVTFFAANRLGAVTTFLNSFSSPEEEKEYLHLFNSPLLINYDKTIEYNRSIKKDTNVRHIITLNKENTNNLNLNEKKSELIGYNDYLSFNELGIVSNYYKNKIKTNFDGKQDSVILFTSGTTGNPKSVVLTNENILASGIYMKNTCKIKLKPKEKCLVCVPFTYPYGFITSALMSLICGRIAILAPNLSINNVNYFIKKEPNIIFGSPAFLELMKKSISNNQDLSSIHSFISGGDFLTSTKIQEATEYFKQHNANVQMCNGSGNAETVATSTSSFGIKYKPNTVGKILVGTDAIIIDDDDNELKYGEEGILCISGKHNFKEYYKETELTEQVKFKYKDKIYFKTGTRGILDTEGYFTLTGRDSRFYIISSLNKIYCDRVQNIMSLIDIIDSVAVIPQENDEMLYKGKAYIVLKEGITPTVKIKDYILKKCKTSLTDPSTGKQVELKKYEIPSDIEFINELPRTMADKIDYNILTAKKLIKCK